MIQDRTSDVENWELGRINRTADNNHQHVYVKGSLAKPNETMLMLTNDKRRDSVLLRLNIEELDALIVLLMYRRSLIDTPDPIRKE